MIQKENGSTCKEALIYDKRNRSGPELSESFISKYKLQNCVYFCIGQENSCKQYETFYHLLCPNQRPILRVYAKCIWLDEPFTQSWNLTSWKLSTKYCSSLSACIFIIHKRTFQSAFVRILGQKYKIVQLLSI